MFWRKTRAAISGFHPLHQALIWQRGFSAVQRPADWAAFCASLDGHATAVRRRKWQLPPRTMDVLAPLVEVICQDIAPAGTLAVAADLRGPDLPEKAGPARRLPVQRPIRSIAEWFTVDPWLRLRAELHDGSRLDLTVTDRTRNRDIHKTSRSGKHKRKRKRKPVQLIRVVRVLPKGTNARRPDQRPPQWIRVQLKQGKRWSLTASAKLSGDVSGDQQIQQILMVMAEPFRWTTQPIGHPPRPAGHPTTATGRPMGNGRDRRA